MGRREVGAPVHRAAKLIDRIGVSTQALQGQAQIAHRIGIVWPQSKGRTATADRPIELAESTIRLGQIGVEIGSVRPHGHGSANQLNGARVVSLLMAQHSEEVQGDRVFLFPRKNLFVQLRGRLQVAGLVHFDRRCQKVLH
jgi:hypothetical protein